VPKGRPVKITFTSEDVLHDIYIPAFRVKADAIPGRYSEIWFEPSQIGDFHLFCAEYCGTKHSGMIGRVVVMEPRDYQAWLSGSDGQPLAARGQQLFQQLACVTCHLNDGTGRGPSLAGVYGSKVELANGNGVVADDGYIRESILTPQMKLVSGFQPVMPTFQGLVNEEGVMSLIEYIKSLPAPAPAQATTAPAARPAQR
jgi:cytochrome c oxidase subunit 2